MRAWAAVVTLALVLPPGMAGADPPPLKAGGWDRAGFRTDVAWLTGASGLDYASTKYALESCARCREGVLWHRWNLEVSKAATTGLMLWGLRELRKNGHDRTASVLRWVFVGVFSGVAAWNTWAAHRGRGE